MKFQAYCCAKFCVVDLASCFSTTAFVNEDFFFIQESLSGVPSHFMILNSNFAAVTTGSSSCKNTTIEHHEAAGVKSTIDLREIGRFVQLMADFKSASQIHFYSNSPIQILTIFANWYLFAHIIVAKKNKPVSQSSDVSCIMFRNAHGMIERSCYDFDFSRKTI